MYNISKALLLVDEFKVCAFHQFPLPDKQANCVPEMEPMVDILLD